MYSILLHEAVAEVSKGKIYTIQNVPIEFVCVTCFNPSHFDTLSNMRPGSSRRSQNRTTSDLSYLLGLRRRSPQRHATTVGDICSKLL